MQTSKAASELRAKTPPNAEQNWNREAELIKRVLEGQAEAFSDLLRPHFKPLTRLVNRFVRNEFDSEDIVQQALLKAYVRLSQFRFQASFRTWLTSIALNEIRQNSRMVSNARLVFDGGKFMESATSDRCDSPFEAYERQERAQRLRHAIEMLPLDYRIVVELFDLEEKNLSDSEAALRISRSAAKSRLFRARHRLGALLTQTKKGFAKS